MSRALLVLYNDEIRRRAIHWIEHAPHDTRVEFKGPKRTLDQNSRMWAMLTDIATQLDWHGVKLTTEDWKLLFLDSLNRELRSMRMVPSLDGDGFVPLGRSSSDLSKEEFTMLIELIFAFGANHGVRWSNESKVEGDAA